VPSSTLFKAYSNHGHSASANTSPYGGHHSFTGQFGLGHAADAQDHFVFDGVVDGSANVNGGYKLPPSNEFSVSIGLILTRRWFSDYWFLLPL